MNQIRNYVEAMFSSLPKTKELVEIKINILENMEEKFKELLDEGKNQNEAIGIVISQFGSIDELKKELGIDDFNNETNNIPLKNYNTSTSSNQKNFEEFKEEYYEFKKKTPFYHATAVMLYILAPLFFIIIDGEILNFIVFFSFIATATGIFIYSDSKNSHYVRMLGIKNLKEDDKESPFNGTVFIIATSIYLLLGFTKNLWHPGWIIFIIAAAITTLLDFFYRKKDVM